MNWKFDISFGVGKPSSFVFLYNGPLRPLSLRIKQISLETCHLALNPEKIDKQATPAPSPSLHLSMLWVVDHFPIGRSRVLFIAIQWNSGFQYSIIINMKKTSYLESSLLLSALESRLTKNPYLSRGVCPSSADARVFLAIERQQKIPNRATHPFLYHWYVIMRQFARRTLMVWLEMDEDDQEDEVISGFTFEVGPFFSKQTEKKRRAEKGQDTILGLLEETEQNGQKKVRPSQKNANKRQKKGQNYVHFNENVNLSHKQIPFQRKKSGSQPKDEHTAALSILTKTTEEGNGVGLMQMHFNVSKRDFIETIKERLEKEEEIIRVEVVMEDLSVRGIVKMQGRGHEELKDRISKWPEISNIRIRRERQKKSDSKSEKKIGRTP